MIRVLIADESPQITDNITRRLALEQDVEVCGTADGGEAAVQQALWLKPDVAVVDAGLPGLDGSQTAQMIVQALPATSVIMMSMEAENDAYRQAMVAGAREFLQKPFTGDDLVAAVHRVHETTQRRGPGGDAEAGAPAPAYTPAARVKDRGSVTTIVSGKGGVGRTTVAINVAALLAAAHPGRVALVDLSLQFGDVAASLNLPTQRSITDLMSDSGTVGPELLEEVLATAPGAVRVLLAPATPEMADYVHASHVSAVLDGLRAEYDFIIVDTPAYLTEVGLRAVEMADHVIMVTDLSVTGVKNARLTRTVLETMGVDPASVLVVGNHRDTAGELDRHGAEGFLAARIAVEIPNAAELIAGSLKKGVPFAPANPKADATAALRSITAVLDPVSQNGRDAASKRGQKTNKDKARRRLFKR